MNPLEDLFNHAKKCGLYNQFNSYADFCKAKYGKGQTKEEHSQDFIDWKNSLPEEERKQFEKALG